MRRLSLTIAGLAAVAGLALAPAAAQASTSGHARAGMVTTSVKTVARKLELGGKTCAALRHDLRNPSASCAGHETMHLTANRPAGAGPDSSTFYKGYAEICGGTPGGPCKSWWVDLHVQFTTSGDQAWVNGFSSSWCTAGGTPLDSCGYSGNGTDLLIMGATFDGGYNFDWVVTNGAEQPGFVYPNWANTGNFCVAPSNGCY
ncbi:MAG: hypothetical protein ACRDNF_06545 [Streptosporangiaceae bacterium]